MLIEPTKNIESSTVMPVQAGLPVGTGMTPKDEAAEKPVHEPSAADLKELAADVQENLKFISDVDLQFSVHEASGRVMVTVREGSTGKLIREIPPKQVLDLAAKFDEMVGMLLDKSG